MANLIQEAANLAIRQAFATITTSRSTSSYPTATSTGTYTPSMTGTPDSMDGEKSFFEKYKTMIIAAAIGVPIQIVAGWFFLRHRKAKKAAAAREREIIEGRLKELEMGLGIGGRQQEDGMTNGSTYEQQSVYAGPKA